MSRPELLGRLASDILNEQYKEAIPPINTVERSERGLPIDPRKHYINEDKLTEIVTRHIENSALELTDRERAGLSFTVIANHGVSIYYNFGVSTLDGSYSTTYEPHAYTFCDTCNHYISHLEEDESGRMLIKCSQGHIMTSFIKSGGN